MLIKLSFRRNLLHIISLLIWRAIRSFELIFIDKYLSFNKNTFYILPMFIGEFFSGLSIYLYQQKFLSIKNIGKSIFIVNFGIKRKYDSITKQYLPYFLYLFY